MEIDCAISRAEYLSGACFGRGTSIFAPQATTSSTASKQFVSLKTNHTSSSFKPPGMSVKNGIPLQPVNLMSVTESKNMQNTGVRSSYWTAVW